MENLWGKIKKSVMEGVSAAAEKTEEYTKIGKSKLDILAVKRKISKNFSELGGIVYDAVKEKNADKVLKSPEVKKLIDSLDELEKELSGKEKKLEDITKKEDSKEEKEE